MLKTQVEDSVPKEMSMRDSYITILLFFLHIFLLCIIRMIDDESHITSVN